MAIFRKIHVQFWSDVFIQSLTPEQKFFFLYLLTNERTKQCGIYEITTRQISYDTGYNVETINKLIDFFAQSKKLQYCRGTNEIAIKNWDKYNSSRSPDVKSLVNKELKSVKNVKLIEWVQSVDTVLPESKSSLRQEPEREPEKNQMEKENEKFPIMTGKEFLEYSKKMKEDQLLTVPLFTAGVKPEHLDKWITLYHIQIVGDNKINKDYNEYRKHFKNWLKKQEYWNPPPALTALEKIKQVNQSSAPPLTYLNHSNEL